MKKLILIMAPLLFTFGCTEPAKTYDWRAVVDSLQIKNDSLIALTQALDREKPVSNIWFDPPYDGRTLKANGISDPSGFIEGSLREKPGLIPLKPVLGGTMRFGNIQILSREWVIADYEDGHIQGRAIYKYRLDDKGALQFELLSAIGPE